MCTTVELLNKGNIGMRYSVPCREVSEVKINQIIVLCTEELLFQRSFIGGFTVYMSIIIILFAV